MPAGPGPPPDRIAPFGVTPLAAATPLWRVFNTTRDSRTFNPCLGASTRFAPIHDAKGDCIPTLYAGQTPEAAMFETVFRDLPPLPLSRRVRASRLEGTAIAVLTPRRALRLAPMFNQNLAIIGQSRQTMIECHGAAAYAQTAAWAEAIHRDFADLDGLVWTSRQHDEVQAMLLFGDRVQPDDLGASKAEPLDHGPRRQWVSDLAAHFRIDLIPG